MRRLMFLLLALAVTASSAATAARQPSVAGDWTLTFNGPQGVIEASATFKQDGETVNGTINGPQGSVECAGTFKESQLALSMTVDAGGQMLTITLNGDLEGDSLKGTFSMAEFGTADWSGKRKN